MGSIAGASDINRAIREIAKEIFEDYPVLEGLALIGIYTRGVIIAKRIQSYLKRLTKHQLPLGKIDINLYRDDTSFRRDAPIVQKTEVPFDVNGKGIILVDDVLYTGRTVRAALDAIKDLGRPRFIRLAVLVDRGGRELPIKADYCPIKLSVKAPERVYIRLKEIDGADNIWIE